MTVISDTLSDVGLTADRGPLYFYTPGLRNSSDDARILTPQLVHVGVAPDGTFTTPDLDPGPARVRIDGIVHDLTIPASPTPVRLWPLIEASVVFPASPAAVIERAVAEYLSTHMPEAGEAETFVVFSTAGEALSGHRAVTRRPDGQIGYASNTNPAHVHAPVWITTGAAANGAAVEAVAYGPLTEPSWNWTPGPVFLGADGLLTQIPPVAPAFLTQIAVATRATELFIDRNPSIVLS